VRDLRGGLNKMPETWATRRVFWLLAMIPLILVSTYSGRAYAQNRPAISFEQKVINATEGFDIHGTNFGPTPGKIHIYFPVSPVELPNGVLTHELTLSPSPSDWASGIIHSKEIALTYPFGAADDQKIRITVSTENGKVTSNVWTGTRFVGSPTILDGSRNITPTQLFMLTGWNFGHAGTLNVHFPTPPQDLNVPIPSPHDNFWKRFVTMLSLRPSPVLSNKRWISPSLQRAD
jgi:hypothetical protein